MRFRLLPSQFVFKALQRIEFPAGHAGNILRGALGSVADRRNALYTQFFEPRGDQMRRSGYRNLPRPFVLRVREIDGRSFAPGEQFTVGLNLFRFDPEFVEYVESVFNHLNVTGLGSHRSCVELIEARMPEPLEFDLTSSLTPGLMEVGLEFLTPTELKDEGGLVPQPEFRVLTARLHERASMLNEIYGSGAALEIDFAAFKEQAAQVEMIECGVESLEITRRSTRTGQTHPIGGFVGDAVYRGSIGSFLPYLELCKWIGVGRQTTWGKGEVSIKHILRLL